MSVTVDFILFAFEWDFSYLLRLAEAHNSRDQHNQIVRRPCGDCRWEIFGHRIWGKNT